MSEMGSELWQKIARQLLKHKLTDPESNRDVVIDLADILPMHADKLPPTSLPKISHMRGSFYRMTMHKYRAYLIARDNRDIFRARLVRQIYKGQGEDLEPLSRKCAEYLQQYFGKTPHDLVLDNPPKNQMVAEAMIDSHPTMIHLQSRLHEMEADYHELNTVTIWLKDYWDQVRQAHIELGMANSGSTDGSVPDDFGPELGPPRFGGFAK